MLSKQRFLMKRSDITLLLPALLLMIAAACANPGSGPDGGPYDETPPKIVAMQPQLGAARQQTKKLTITFDEMVKIENAQDNIVFSPPQTEQPEIKTVGRNISVTFIDSLKANTTYTIDFSDAIVDCNEGNPLGNFTYFFSTGEEVDTMEVAGYVLAADNLEPLKGVTVGLHSNLADSAFTGLAFDRVGRTDGNGHFVVKGVAPGDYRIYALRDMDGDYRYARGELLAWLDEPIRPGSFPDVRQDTLWADTVTIDTIMTVPFTHFTPDDVVLLAFTERNPVCQLLKTQREPEWFRLFFTAPMERMPRVRGLNFDDRDAFVVEHSAGFDTLTFWLRDTVLVNMDSLEVELAYEATNDSVTVPYLQTDTLELVPKLTYERRMKLREKEMERFQKALERRHKRGDFSQETPPAEPLKVQFNIEAKLAPDQNQHFKLPEPALKVDTAGIHLFLQVDTLYEEVPFRLERDSLALLDYTLRGAWRPGQKYVLNVDSACITGISGRVNLASDNQFSIAGPEDFGALFLLLPDADSTAVVQLLSGSEKLLRQVPVEEGRADFFYLEPGEVYVRLFNDRNRNGRWDEGSYAEKRQAEEVYYFPQKFNIRANWDLEQTWRLDDVPRFRQKPRELVKQKEDNKKATPKDRNAERERAKRGS